MSAPNSVAAPSALPSGRGLGRHLGRQGAMLFSGFALAQICSFARNALIGHWLSRGDFGIAATITIALQLLEILSDLGADRLLVQATDGDDPRLMAAAHTTLLLRGAITTAVLFAGAGSIVDFFGIPHARHAFELAALVPLVKSFLHLDARRQQRDLQNRSYMLVEVVPQAAALAVTIPCLHLTQDYLAVVWVALAQALLMVVSSQAVARCRYSFGFDRTYLRRLVAFGWPIWLSAFPLALVYQGDRVLIGRMLGMDAVGAYSAAFLVAMVPGLLAAKVANALCLPLLSAARDDRDLFLQRYLVMIEGAAVAAAVFVVGFVIAGGDIMPKAFGMNYINLHGVIGCLAAMWALRMVQSIPGMALIATGDTRPLLIASLVRAAGLSLAWGAIVLGYGIVGVAAAGIAAELVTIGYVLVRSAAGTRGLARATFLRATYPVVAGLVAAACTWAWPITGTLKISIPVAIVLGASAALAGFAIMPRIRTLIEDYFDEDPVPASANARTPNISAKGEKYAASA